MKILQYVSLLIILNLGIVISGDSAYTLENGNRQMGVFQPITYGMKNNVELSTHPLLFFIKPNVEVKKYHGEFNGLGMASRFSFDYPTQLLKLIQRKGKFGILAKDPDIGEISNLFVFQGELLTTKKLDNISITGKVGLSLCPGCELDSRHMVDLPLAYPRMAVYHHGIAANAGVDMDYNYSEKITFKTDIDLIFSPEEDVFFEHKLLGNFQLSTKTILSAGYKLTHGSYPFGKQWDVFPIIDLSWIWVK